MPPICKTVVKCVARGETRKVNKLETQYWENNWNVSYFKKNNRQD